MTQLDDARIEDSVHCDLCGTHMCLGDNEVVLIDDCMMHFRPEASGVFCMNCARQIHDAYQQALKEGACEHGVEDGEWCKACSEERKRAEKEYLEDK